jgi:hypothetical protein
MGISFVAALLATAGINVVVDPKGLYQIVQAEGFNAYKPFQSDFSGEVKALAVYRYRPDTLVFGASTVTFGIDPVCHTPGVPGVSRLYNYGGAGSATGSLITNLSDLISVGSIRRLVVEARFETHTFVAVPRSAPAALPGEDPSDRISSTVGRHLPRRYATTYLQNLFSWGELALSVQTVLANRKADKSFLFRSFGENGSYDQEWLRRWGAHVITEQNLIGHVGNYTNFLLSKVSNEMGIDLTYVDQLAQAAKLHQLDVDLFITPVHVTELLLFKEGGIWPLYERYKTELLQRVEDVRSRYSVNMRLFDFGTLNPMVSQTIKKVDLNQGHEPFSDPVHFKVPVGEMILATILKCGISKPVPPNFGLELDRSNISAHLAKERAKLAFYVEEHPELAELIGRTIRARLKGPES